MRQLARHHGMVVGILRLMLMFCVVQCLGILPPSFLLAGSLKASWNANTEPDLAGYKIYYGESSGNYTSSINVGKVTQYTVNQLKDGVVYYFAVTAYDSAGNESGYSLEVSAKVPAVDSAPPTVASVTPHDQTTLEIKFSEAVSQASALNKFNYAIDNGITIAGAAFQQGSTTIVMLSTSSHETGKTYKITIQNIADRAPVPNVMTQAVSFNYLIPAVDRTPPAVASFRALNQQTLEVVFSEAVSVASAQYAANYSINNNVTVQSAQLQQDTRTVRLATTLHATGVTYTLTVRNIADRAATPNIMSQPTTHTYSFQSTDTTPPAVSNVRLVNPTMVEVLFNEPITVASAQNQNNYTISHGIAVVSAALQNDTRTVFLTTSQHTSDGTYSITIRNISDRAVPANVMPQAVKHDYIYQAEDRTPPEAKSATLIDLTRVLIVFSEAVTAASAQNVNNYRISDNIQVQAAQLAGNGLEVTLITSAHQFNKDYNITIVNIKDRSAAANTIAPNTTLTYFLVNNDGNNGPGLSVNGLNPARYAVDTMRVGKAYYIDRPYVIRQIPNSKRGAVWIKTANADRANNAPRFLEFTLMRESNVYVAYDSRALQPPNWLKDSFTITNESILVSESAGKLNLWKSRFVPGRVTLGGNMAAGAQANTTLSMYVVLIEDVQSPSNPDSPAPQNFVLKQNYPNPFSRSDVASGQGYTKIEYYLQESHSVTLTIHNAIGQVVRKLYSGALPAGTHSAVWDGRDENGTPLPSGTYLCTLEVREEVNDGSFAMTASINRQTRVMTLLK
ncbi:MAG: fibronectin type III domain-containing protein [candidate division KSB1 bacterium]|nr:fibronectin type III domain-containing protein [candidate division KSB1 bacterium]